MAEEDVVVDNSNTTEMETVAPEITETVAEVPEESIDDVKAELAKAKEIAENQRIRAEKAEKKARETPAPRVEESKPGQMSSTDLLAVMKANVHEDDIERVERFAKSEGKSIKDALKDPELKAILDVRSEQRTSASAANVTNVRRGPSKVTPDTLLENAAAGKLPDNEEDIAKLMQAKIRSKG